LIAANVLLQMN